MKYSFMRSGQKISSSRFFSGLRDERGYALPTVLLISLVIIVISTSVTYSVRRKIETAIELKNRSTAYLKSHSAMNEVLYNVLISTFTATGMEFQSADSSLVTWNLYGEPIELSSGVIVRLRDCAGMVSSLFQSEYLKKLVRYVSRNSSVTSSFADTLADWQDADDFKRLNGAESFEYRLAHYHYQPRNFFIQVPREISLLKGFNQDIFSRIQPDLVYWSSGTINFLTMSENLLKAVLENDSLTEQLIQLRTEGRLTAGIFRDLSGITLSDRHRLSPSGWIKVEITAKVEKSMDKIEAVIVKRELFDKPFMVVEWRR